MASPKMFSPPPPPPGGVGNGAAAEDRHHEEFRSFVHIVISSCGCVWGCFSTSNVPSRFGLPFCHSCLRTSKSENGSKLRADRYCLQKIRPTDVHSCALTLSSLLELESMTSNNQKNLLQSHHQKRGLCERIPVPCG